MRSLPGSPAAGLAAVACAIPLAVGIGALSSRYGGAPERAVLATGALLLAAAPLPLALYFLRRGREARPTTAALIALSTLAVLALAVTMYVVSSAVVFPADFLNWSESDFVNDIIKLRVGYPLYTAQANSESFTYPPGAQLLTYFLASLVGKPTSIPVYRLIQVGFALGSGLVGLACARRIVAMAAGRPVEDAPLWSALWLPVFLLVATSPPANGYVLALHNDGLAQLVCLVAFWLLLRYVMQRERGVLVAMAVVPAAGFLVKQSLILWGVLYALQLAVFDRPRSLRRLVAFALGSSALLGAVLLTCYALWGEPFLYWVFTVIREHGVSPLRSFEHLRREWGYFALLLVAGMLLLGREESRRLLLGPWLVVLILFSVETYTSGVAWMLNHMGPGTLLATVWLLAGVAACWTGASGAGAAAWLRPGLAAAVGSVVLVGLGLVRIPLPAVPPDARRYAAEIEREFRDQEAGRVLLDIGSWVYLPEGVVMKDRAPAIGERGYSATGDFSGTLERIRQRRYARILVRSARQPDFWYDHELWPRSSGIRAALQTHYQEVRTIRAATPTLSTQSRGYTLEEISVLEPRAP